MLRPTMGLIQLQTLAISDGKTIINENGEYKAVSEVFDILHAIWLKSDDEKKKRIEKLIVGAPYRCK